ncbi:sigma-70 family RNA polymerase sigma factor [Phormidesmis priestleyi]
MTIEPAFDEPLLKRIAQQDQAALAELYDRYAQILYAVAFKSLGSAQESEEVVLDVFSQVWRTATHYDNSRSRVDTWLFMIARSRTLDRLRRLQRSTKIAVASVDAVKSQPHPLSNDPIEGVLLSERRAHVLTAIAQLPEEQRQAIELAYYKGLTHSEIAAQLGLSLGTVKTRIRLGLSKLRVALGNWEPR